MRSDRPALLAALAANLLLHIVLIALPASVPVRTKALDTIGDAREYEALAENLLNHATFTRDTQPPYRPELFRTPLYPGLLAPGAVLPGGVVAWGLFMQALLCLVLILLTQRLAVELGLPPGQAVAAALLTGLSLNIAFISTKLVTETLFAVLLTVTLMLYARSLRGSRPLDVVGAGVGLGLLSLTRPIALYLPLLFAAHLLWRATRRRCSLVMPLVLVAATSLTVLPWVVRNHRSARFAGISTAEQHNLYLYNAATVLASVKGITPSQARDSMQAEARARFGDMDSSDEPGYWRSLAVVAGEVCRRWPVTTALVQLSGFATTMLVPLSIQPLLEHCGASGYASAPPHVMQDALRLLASGRILPALDVAWRGRIALLPPLAVVLLVMAGLQLLVVLLGIALSLFRRRLGAAAWLLLPLLYLTLLPGPVGEARFRAPVEPLLCILAVIGFAAGRRAGDKAGAR